MPGGLLVSRESKGIRRLPRETALLYEPTAGEAGENDGDGNSAVVPGDGKGGESVEGGGEDAWGDEWAGLLGIDRDGGGEGGVMGEFPSNEAELEAVLDESREFSDEILEIEQPSDGEAETSPASENRRLLDLLTDTRVKESGKVKKVVEDFLERSRTDEEREEEEEEEKEKETKEGKKKRSRKKMSAEDRAFFDGGGDFLGKGGKKKEKGTEKNGVQIGSDSAALSDSSALSSPSSSMRDKDSVSEKGTGEVSSMEETEEAASMTEETERRPMTFTPPEGNDVIGKRGDSASAYTHNGGGRRQKDSRGGEKKRRKRPRASAFEDDEDEDEEGVWGADVEQGGGKGPKTDWELMLNLGDEAQGPSLVESLIERSSRFYDPRKIINWEKRERAILCGVDIKSTKVLRSMTAKGYVSGAKGDADRVALTLPAGHFTCEESLEELAELAGTAGLAVVGITQQRLNSPNSKMYIGPGKVRDVRTAMRDLNCKTVVIDAELTPTQQKNLEEAFGGVSTEIKVLDRTALILDIFAQHANTKEGKLQVALALCTYRLPRLTKLWTHLEKQGGGGSGQAGGVGLRGPGETQIEIDRRMLYKQIELLTKTLERVKRHRRLHRRNRKRSGMPVIALVGYTNAGKSTLLNRLTQAGVMAQNILFATLDPTTRRIRLPGSKLHPEVLLTDTVGFIQRLPTTLVAAFRATLEEVNEADLIVHVVDASSRVKDKQMETVMRVLRDIDAGDTPIVTLWNKIDLLQDSGLVQLEAAQRDYTVAISAKTGQGMRDFIATLEEALASALGITQVLLPYTEGQLVSEIYQRGAVETIDHLSEGSLIRCRVPDALRGRLKPFEVKPGSPLALSAAELLALERPLEEERGKDRESPITTAEGVLDDVSLSFAVPGQEGEVGDASSLPSGSVPKPVRFGFDEPEGSSDSDTEFGEEGGSAEDVEERGGEAVAEASSSPSSPAVEEGKTEEVFVEPSEEHLTIESGDGSRQMEMDIISLDNNVSLPLSSSEDPLRSTVQLPSSTLSSPALRQVQPRILSEGFGIEGFESRLSSLDDDGVVPHKQLPQLRLRTGAEETGGDLTGAEWGEHERPPTANIALGLQPASNQGEEGSGSSDWYEDPEGWIRTPGLASSDLDTDMWGDVGARRRVPVAWDGEEIPSGGEGKKKGGRFGLSKTSKDGMKAEGRREAGEAWEGSEDFGGDDFDFEEGLDGDPFAPLPPAPIGRESRGRSRRGSRGREGMGVGVSEDEDARLRRMMKSERRQEAESIDWTAISKGRHKTKGKKKEVISGRVGGWRGQESEVQRGSKKSRRHSLKSPEVPTSVSQEQTATKNEAPSINGHGERAASPRRVTREQAVGEGLETASLDENTEMAREPSREDEKREGSEREGAEPEPAMAN
uniref:Hflx-type G domain-containing protein n=1 Tax=Chromera velia CCMP2878 TaxID=1169474 RepID=A0A0G4HLV3_9ALVE|eukprot:Cvel_28949.t1-p1 / transcript=Cvel_28949.t1 / gene=Cvel_28949 / organism=Chromera_velia_CCMP2878 / gene_product=GTPase HflX, putative / transcript_product=GTPase HflX, putative / location=Cvel_scaffold3883:1232-9830(-) / protein_length=1394 / sequence_SO=supercontig / SO=protein_coding / is_pseudo=false